MKEKRLLTVSCGFKNVNARGGLVTRYLGEDISPDGNIEEWYVWNKKVMEDEGVLTIGTLESSTLDVALHRMEMFIGRIIKKEMFGSSTIGHSVMEFFRLNVLPRLDDNNVVTVCVDLQGFCLPIRVQPMLMKDSAAQGKVIAEIAIGIDKGVVFMENIFPVNDLIP